MKNPKNIVEFDNLHTYFYTDTGVVKAVNGVTFSIPEGATVGVVGESGCGKSVTSLSVMQLLPRPVGQCVGGEIRFNKGDGEAYNIVNAPTAVMEKIRGNKISMIFQEPMTSLNPVMKVGKQVQEAILLHRKISKKEAKEEEIKKALEVIKEKHWMTKDYQAAFKTIYDWAKTKI